MTKKSKKSRKTRIEGPILTALQAKQMLQSEDMKYLVDQFGFDFAITTLKMGALRHGVTIVEEDDSPTPPACSTDDPPPPDIK